MFSFVNMENELHKNLFSDQWFHKVKFEKVSGRYVTNKSLKKLIRHLNNSFSVKRIGESVQGRDVSSFEIGSGEIKVLVWSQMHGNESTTTKAVFDLLCAFKNEASNPVLQTILERCTIQIIPILNPDGAKAYTRVNANSVDLNRDLQNLSQPESSLLKLQYEEFQPDYCLNLHDQRTIFSAGDKPKPATLSFLTPAKDEERTIDESRKKSMGLIAGIASDLNEQLSGCIGRYDDSYNIHCAGDTFQTLGTPTLLFEAGHYQGDYLREEVRKYVLRALLSCLYRISEGKEQADNFEAYFDIPENEKLFNDIVIRGAALNGEKRDVSIQYKEGRKHDKIEFVPIVQKIAGEILNYGHREINAEGKELKLPGNTKLIENVVVNKILLNNTELRFKEG